MCFGNNNPEAENPKESLVVGVEQALSVGTERTERELVLWVLCLRVIVNKTHI